MVPDLDLARVRKWVAARNARLGPEARVNIRFDIDVGDRTITVLECQVDSPDDPHPKAPMPVCRFRYTKTRSEWSLYWPDLEHRSYHRFDKAAPTPHIDELIRWVTEDRTGTFPF